jgi:hypothetical protein
LFHYVSTGSTSNKFEILFNNGGVELSLSEAAGNSIGETTNNPTFDALGTGADTLHGSTVLLPGIAAAAGSGYVCYGTGNTLTTATTTCGSSRADHKNNITPLADTALSEVLALQPVSFNFKPEYGDPKPTHLGFTAENMQSVEPRLADYNPDGSVHGVEYQNVTALLVKAIQEQQYAIQEQRHEIEYLKQQLSQH